MKNVSLAALALAALGALLYVAFPRSEAREVEVAPEEAANAASSSGDETEPLARPAPERVVVAAEPSRDVAAAPASPPEDVAEAEVPAAVESSAPEEERSIRVVVRTPSGESFHSTVTVPHLFQAVATATYLGETWPPPEDAPAVLRCGAFTPRGADYRTGVVGTIRPTCEGLLWVALVRTGTGRVLNARVVPPDEDEAVFVVDPGTVLAELCTLRFRPVDARTEAPIAGNMRATMLAGPTIREAVRQEDGTFLAEQLDPGPRAISITAAGYDPLQLDVELEPGEARDLGDVAVTPVVRGTLRVTVLRGRGAEEGEAVVRCLPLEWIQGLDDPLTMGRAKKVGPRDEASVKLTVGTWAVRAESASPTPNLCSRFEVVEVDEGTAVATVELVPTTRVRLTAAAKSHVRVRDAEDRWAHELVYVPAGEERSVPLAPGSYTLLVRTQGGEERAIPLQVGAGDVTVALD